MLADEADEFRRSPAMNFQQTHDSPAPFGLFPELLDNHIRVQVVLVNEKVIRALRDYVPGVKRGVGKILEIESNDGLSTRAHSGSQHMPVFGVVGHGGNQRLVALDPRIREMQLQLANQVRRLCRSDTELNFKCAYGFQDDVLGPARQV